MDSKFKAFVIGLLRRGSMRWKPASEALNDAKEVYYIASKTGKQLRRVKFKCAHCHQFFKRTDVKIDHIEPVVPVTGFTTWDDYIFRMYPLDKKAFQILCKGCDKVKTQGENQIRKEIRKISKKKVD